jgi:hypothetical protein
MQLHLPVPVASYFAADKRVPATIARCFVHDAIVKDESRTHTGVAAIERWVKESSAKYDYTSRPVGSETIDGMTVVTCHVAGNFPGSPVDLRYYFRVEGDKIAALEIKP